MRLRRSGKFPSSSLFRWWSPCLTFLFLWSDGWTTKHALRQRSHLAPLSPPLPPNCAHSLPSLSSFLLFFSSFDHSLCYVIPNLWAGSCCVFVCVSVEACFSHPRKSFQCSQSAFVMLALIVTDGRDVGSCCGSTRCRSGCKLAGNRSLAFESLLKRHFGDGHFYYSLTHIHSAYNRLTRGTLSLSVFLRYLLCLFLCNTRVFPFLLPRTSRPVRYFLTAFGSMTWQQNFELAWKLVVIHPNQLSSLLQQARDFRSRTRLLAFVCFDVQRLNSCMADAADFMSTPPASFGTSSLGTSFSESFSLLPTLPSSVSEELDFSIDRTIQPSSV